MRPTTAASRAASWDELGRALVGAAQPPDVLSVDVFDTCLTRTCGAPTDLFLWLGRRLHQQGVIDCSAEVFAAARVRAEQHVWRRAGGMDSRVGLADLYDELVRLVGLSPQLVPELVTAELELEREVSRPVPGARRALDVAATTGARVVFTSDTYLGGATVQELLELAGVRPPGTPVLVSSDTAASKASGRLYSRVVAGGPPGAREVLHLGDNPHSDVDVPRSLGHAAAWLPAGRANRYEQAMSAQGMSTSGLASAFAGASRLARLGVPAPSEHARAIRDVAAGVAAPVLVAYVLWLLERAREHSLQRLYFLARDGQILAEIARRLAKRIHPELEVRYLLVSRRATNLAATFSVDEEETGWVFRDLATMTVGQALAALDLTWADVAERATRAGVSGPARDAAGFGPLLRQLLDDPAIRDTVLDHARRRRDVVTAHLAQEGLLDEVSTGIVDFGGVGSQVRAVSTIVAAAGGAPPRIFLVGLDDPAAAGLAVPPTDPGWLQDTETWLYDHRRRRGIVRPRGFGTFLQLFCAADHGTVLGYEPGPHGVSAILEADHDDAVVAWGLPTLRAAIASFVDELVLANDLVDPAADLRDVACELVETVWTRPTVEEASAWGAFPFEGAQAAGSTVRPLAHRYTPPQMWRDFRLGRFPNLGWQHWYEGSLALSAAPVRYALQGAHAAYDRLATSDTRAAGRLADLAKQLKRRGR